MSNRKRIQSRINAMISKVDAYLESGALTPEQSAMFYETAEVLSEIKRAVAPKVASPFKSLFGSLSLFETRRLPDVYAEQRPAPRPGEIRTLAELQGIQVGTILERVHSHLRYAGRIRFMGLHRDGEQFLIRNIWSEGDESAKVTTAFLSDCGILPYSNDHWNRFNYLRHLLSKEPRQ